MLKKDSERFCQTILVLAVVIVGLFAGAGQAMAQSNRDAQEDKTIYRVVINDEEQYAIWPTYKEIPRGWHDTGKKGTKDECLAYMTEVWTDMRPLSLRKKMDAAAKNPPPPPPPNTDNSEKTSLVEKLSTGDHPVEVELRPEKSVKLFKKEIDRGYVHIKFTDTKGTKGGTSLGIRLDKGASKLDDADFENEKGTVHLEGELTLDYVKMRCIANIDLSTLKGKGHLVKDKEADEPKAKSNKTP